MRTQNRGRPTNEQLRECFVHYNERGQATYCCEEIDRNDLEPVLKMYSQDVSITVLAMDDEDAESKLHEAIQLLLDWQSTHDDRKIGQGGTTVMEQDEKGEWGTERPLF